MTEPPLTNQENHQKLYVHADLDYMPMEIVMKTLSYSERI